jgi:hypothetical protein
MTRTPPLAVQTLEDRSTPSASLVALDFDPSLSASGDFNGDGFVDFATVTKAGETTKLTIFYSGVPDRLESTTAIFESSFLGGARVAAGDLDGDGKAELAVSASIGGSGRVVVLRALDVEVTPAIGGGDIKGVLQTQFVPIASFFGIADSNFRGGSSVAIADLSGDGKADLVVGAGFSGGPRVAVYEGASVTKATPTRLVNDFFALPDVAFRGGVSIDAGDVDGDGRADLIVGPGFGGGQRARVISGFDILANKGGTAAPLADFFLGGGDSGNRLGLIVSYEPPYNDHKFGGLTLYPYLSEFIEGRLVIGGGVAFLGRDFPKPPGTVPDLDERAFVQ